jgi:hypothetical protein
MGGDLTPPKKAITCRPKGKISRGCLRKTCSDIQSQRTNCYLWYKLQVEEEGVVMLY